MTIEYLTKIEINLPVNRKTISKTLPLLTFLFTDTDGIEGCTYSTPSIPAAFMGKWRHSITKEIVDDEIVCIHACCDLNKLQVEIKDIIKILKKNIESAGEERAWITYSSVCAISI